MPQSRLIVETNGAQAGFRGVQDDRGQEQGVGPASFRQLRA